MQRTVADKSKAAHECLGLKRPSPICKRVGLDPVAANAEAVALPHRGFDSRGSEYTVGAAEVSSEGWIRAIGRVKEGAGTVIKQVRPLCQSCLNLAAKRNISG